MLVPFVGCVSTEDDRTIGEASAVPTTSGSAEAGLEKATSNDDFQVLAPKEGIDPQWYKQPKEKFDSLEELYAEFFERLRAKDFEAIMRLTVSKEEHQQQLFPVFYAHKKDSPTYEQLRTFTWRQLFLESASGAIDGMNWLDKAKPEFHGLTEPTAVERYQVGEDEVVVYKRIRVKYSTPGNLEIRTKRIFGHVLDWGGQYCFLFYPN